MPFGYLITTGLAAVCTLFALRPPRPARSSPANVSYWLGFLVGELPFLLFYVLLASTLLALAQGDLTTPVGFLGLGLAVVTTCGLAGLVVRALRTRPVVEAALRAGLGDASLESGSDSALARVLVAPFFFRRRDVERVANIAYGDAGRTNLLDVYRHRSRPAGCPVLVHLHGGAFRSGRKSREGRPLLYRLASQGWVCVSANYRLSPAGKFPDYVVDAKKVIAWVREQGGEHGAGSEVLVVAGSSAGGYLAAMAGLTPNDPAFQPGFEDADTSVSAVVSLYGYYGGLSTDAAMPSSPAAYLRPDAPPFFIAHGELDTIVLVEDARSFVAGLRSASDGPVVYAELPGAQHTFDLFHSLRSESVVDGIEAFTSEVRERAAT